MTKSPRTLANRENAKKSTGPRSEAGKAIVARNGCHHGLSGSFCVLDHEDASEFQTTLDQYRSDFNPETTDETFLVEHMVQSRWNLARARRIEKHVFDQLAGQPEDPDNPDARIAAELLAASSSAPATIHRYAVAAERSYFRARRELQQGRSHELRSKANKAQTWLQDELHEFRNPPPPQPVEDQKPVPPPAFDLQQSVQELRKALRGDFEPRRLPTSNPIPARERFSDPRPSEPRP